MTRNFNAEERRAGLTLVVKPLEDPEQPVDAHQFLQAASKWLTSLASFAADSGLSVRWEIAELKRSSAVLEVIPIDVLTGIVATSIAQNWGNVVQEIETTGRTSMPIHRSTIKDMESFTSATNSLTVLVNAGTEVAPRPITLLTQKRLREAFAALPSDEYSQEGTIKGNLAVLNSWNPEDRWFRLRVPLAPEKPIKCVYSDEVLVRMIGDTFEKPVNVTGLLHYRQGETWPHRIEARSVRKQPSQSLDQFLAGMKPVPLPFGMDSVSAIRSLRDAE